MTASVYRALIRTHHITSRKKVATLKAASKKLECYVLLKSGGVPGIMFVEGQNHANVQQWVNIVHGLRYRDYQLVSGVVEAHRKPGVPPLELGSLQEVSAVKEMAAIVENQGALDWWREGMGFTRT